MNRLQKKCVIATVGIHLLLLTILIVGPAFFNPQPKADNTQVLDIISPNVIEAAFNSGRKDATPPPPAPEVTPSPPVPAPPTPAMQTPPPPEPKPVMTPTLPERLKNLFTPEPKPEPVKPAPQKTESQTHQIQVSTQLVMRTAPKNSSSKDNSRQTANAINSAIKNLRRNLSPGMVVDVPGNSSVAYSSYKDALATIYYNAWVTPDEAAADEADTIVKITVASDGTVISARIVTSSGDEKTDASVQRALNRVPSVPPLPDKSKSEQEFTIDFNLKTKRMLE
jgi:periplasmic protein TonB